jgi:hypothetical protein
MAPLQPVPELLNDQHVLDGFDCGEPEINEFLLRHALLHAVAGYSRTWVIADPTDHIVQGFKSVAASSQAVKVKVKGVSKKLVPGIMATCPYPSVPVVIIGHLARRKELEKAHLGERLLVFAIVKALETSNNIGVAGIVLDALTERLLSYYRKKKFERLPYPETDKRRMLLTMADARATIESL